MPCFKGLAVSIHTPDGPIPEYSVQTHQRSNRITTYIPVPPPQIGPDGSPTQSTFAVSITLLTPGMRVPYSQPKPTDDNPFPQGRIVSGLPALGQDRGTYLGPVAPFIPTTTSPNETVAAYIYFDGRPKEEVATLLRKGEETWVNSRWVSIPDSEGGGIAEREFLFREVGLERWLNGLDLSASADKAKKIERRQKKLEKKRRIKKEALSSDDDEMSERKPRIGSNGILRYGADASSPVEAVMADDPVLSDDSSDDEPPEPEASGQIKVALFRVMASGEIKRGEYSPQFDVHDDEGVEGTGDNGGDEDVDHTTSFAKPKSLDPKSISTQTVTGIDPPESPFAIFTFFYRGDKQLRKMGVIEDPEQKVAIPTTAKRKSKQTDFSKLGPLKNTGTKGFSSYRDNTSKPRKGSHDDDAMDSDADDDDFSSNRLREDIDDDKEGDDGAHKSASGGVLSPEEQKRAEEVAEGVQKIKLKRQHSQTDISASEYQSHPTKSPATKIGVSASSAAFSTTTPASISRSLESSSHSPTGGAASTPSSLAGNAGTPNDRSLSGEPSSTSGFLAPLTLDDVDACIASPAKRHRSSVQQLEGSLLGQHQESSPAQNVDQPRHSGSEITGGIFSGVGTGAANMPQQRYQTSQTAMQAQAQNTALPDEDEEL